MIETTREPAWKPCLPMYAEHLCSDFIVIFRGGHLNRVPLPHCSATCVFCCTRVPRSAISPPTRTENRRRRTLTHIGDKRTTTTTQSSTRQQQTRPFELGKLHSHSPYAHSIPAQTRACQNPGYHGFRVCACAQHCAIAIAPISSSAPWL